MKLLIADNERFARYTLRSLVDWDAEGFTQVLEAASGPEALKLIREHRPEVALLDIKMPGMSGLEVAGQAALDVPRMRTIIVSGFAEFEYAQTALRLPHVGEYLLKPVDADELRTAVRKVVRELDAEQGQSIASDTALLASIFLLEEADAAWIQLSDRLGGGEWQPCWRVAVSEGMMDEAEGGARRALRLKLAGGLSCLLLNGQEADLRAWRPSCQGYGGVSGVGMRREDLYRLFEEALKHMKTAMFYMDARMVYSTAPGERRALERQMALLIRVIENNEPAPVFLESVRLWMRGERPGLDALVSLYNQAQLLSGNGDRGSVEILRDWGDLLDAFRDAEAYLAGLSAALVGETGVEEEEWQAELMQCIEENLMGELRLGDLAAKYNVSIGHLSALLKRRLGKNFRDYLAERRLANAAYLLQHTYESVACIAEMCGYNDYFHFNKQFKRHYGVPPATYRREKGETSG